MPGHAALIAKARRLAGRGWHGGGFDFRQSTQFGPKEDFSSYPRRLAEDAALCRSFGADVIFAAVRGGDVRAGPLGFCG